MKAYKITGKLGDICSFVGGNEVKKGDMVYLHSESDMSIEAMKQALEALEMSRELEDRGLVDFKKYELTKDKDILVKLELAITSLRQALSEAQLSVNENSHAIEQASSVSSIQSDKTSDAEKQEPVAWMRDDNAIADTHWGKYGPNKVFESDIPLYIRNHTGSQK